MRAHAGEDILPERTVAADLSDVEQIAARPEVGERTDPVDQIGPALSERHAFLDYHLWPN